VALQGLLRATILVEALQRPGSFWDGGRPVLSRWIHYHEMLQTGRLPDDPIPQLEFTGPQANRAPR
jgi:hypothetical protein